MPNKLKINPREGEVFLLSVGLPYDCENLRTDDDGETNIRLMVPAEFPDLVLKLAKKMVLAVVHVNEHRYSDRQISKIKRKIGAFIRKEDSELKLNNGLESEYPTVVVTCYLRDAFSQVEDMFGESELDFIFNESLRIRDKVVADANQWAMDVNSEISSQNPPGYAIDSSLTEETSFFDRNRRLVVFKSEVFHELYENIQEIFRYVTHQDSVVVRRALRANQLELSSTTDIESQIESRQEDFSWPSPIGILDIVDSNDILESSFEIKSYGREVVIVQTLDFRVGEAVEVDRKESFLNVPCRFGGFTKATHIDSDSIKVHIVDHYPNKDEIELGIDQKLGFSLVTDLLPFWRENIAFKELERLIALNDLNDCEVDFFYDPTVDRYAISKVVFLRQDMGGFSFDQINMDLG